MQYICSLEIYIFPPDAISILDRYDIQSQIYYAMDAMLRRICCPTLNLLCFNWYIPYLNSMVQNRALRISYYSGPTGPMHELHSLACRMSFDIRSCFSLYAWSSINPRWWCIIWRQYSSLICPFRYVTHTTERTFFLRHALASLRLTINWHRAKKVPMSIITIKTLILGIKLVPKR